jgi:hypothetical protein
MLADCFMRQVLRRVIASEYEWRKCPEYLGFVIAVHYTGRHPAIAKKTATFAGVDADFGFSFIASGGATKQLLVGIIDCAFENCEDSFRRSSASGRFNSSS